MAEARYEGEILLPEAIIQHILSFLGGKEAARTTILSKAWYSAWLTRPNLDFDFRDGSFGTAKKTIERYESLNLKVERLSLSMRDARPEDRDSATELIVKAMKLGATGLHIEGCLLDLPQEVLGSENLVKLSVSRCNVYQGKVSCSKLKSLSLRRVYIIGPLIWDICSSCPLIEELSFSGCMLELPIPRMTLFIDALPLSPVTDFIEPITDRPIIPWYEFRKLERLLLENLIFDSSFFHDISSKFPGLKDLTLRGCGGFKSLQISSPSIECITIVEGNVRWAPLDVPNIRHFAYSGSKLPFLSFKTAPISREWKSDISISCYKPLASWFVKLKKFLKRLSSSKITLSLKFLTSSNDGLYLLREPIDVEGVQSLAPPLLENLMLDVDKTCSELLNALFRSCRPKFISGNHSMSTICLWDTLAPEGCEICSIRDRIIPYFDDLVEVNVEVFEESVAEWRPAAWKTLRFDASSYYTRKIRFRLGWGPEPSTFT